MKLKESKFTYKTDDGCGGMLMYNSLRGTQSFVRVPAENVEEYRSIIEGEVNGKGTLTQQLLHHGILVPQSRDEQLELKRKYLNVVGNDSLILIINPTEKCNFRCKYCYETFQNGRMSESTQEGIVRYVNKNIHKYRMLYIMWFGGEPLLELNVIERLSMELIEICKKNRKIYAADITSNGYLLTKDTFNRLTKCRIYNYQITVDGFRDTHDKQRFDIAGNPTYDVIMKNLKDITKNSRHRSFSMTIRVNVSKELLDRLDEFVEIHNKLFGGDDRVFVDIHLVGNWLEKTEEDFLDQIIQRDELRTVYQKVLSHPKPLHNISHNFLNPGGRVCYAGKANSMLISSNGSIHKCTLLFNLNDSVLGNIDQQGNISDYNHERDKSWLCNDENCKNIKKCFYAPICFGDSCPSAHSGIYNNEEVATGCPKEKNSLDLLLKIINRSKPFTVVGGK